MNQPIVVNINDALRTLTRVTSVDCCVEVMGHLQATAGALGASENGRGYGFTDNGHLGTLLRLFAENRLSLSLPTPQMS